MASTSARTAGDALPDVEKLQISELAHDVTSISVDEAISPNPWKDDTAEATKKDGDLETSIHRLKTPDPSALDESIASGLGIQISLPASDTVPELVNAQEILEEFDPLVNQEEKDAKDAWESSEGHPPHPAPSPVAPTPPSKDQTPPPNDAQASSSFPSLAALARSFQMPKLTRSRPLSLDVAKPVPSPDALSSFASQQQQPPKYEPVSQTNLGTSRTSSPGIPRENSLAVDRGKGDPPFDFPKFLDQMKSKNAEPVSKYLKSFLSNFAKRTFTVSDQIKIINDFLNFIAKQMRECEVWRSASDVEFDNAMEGMEKLVMNQLYQFTFTPQVVRAVPRRQITADDLERDRVLSQRIALFGWVEEKHLDIPEGDGSKGFLMFAQQELLKINHYKAPRDKLICILNCCKVIFGLIRHLRTEEGADSFVPILIFVVLKSNPENLLSNVEFINRFRNPVKLQSEAGYYLSSLMGAVSFIETMDHTSLSNITQEEFEKNVEEAIQSLPNDGDSPAIHFAAEPPPASSWSNSTPSHAGEESAQPLSLPTPAQTLSDDAKRLLQKTGDTISKPLNAISRILNEAIDSAASPFAPFETVREQRTGTPPPVPHWSHPDQIRQYQQQQDSPRSGSPRMVPQTPMGDGIYQPPLQTPYKPRVRRVPSPSFSPGIEETPSRPGPYTNQPLAIGPSQSLFASPYRPDYAHVSRTPTPNLDLVGMQEEIDTAHEQAAEAARDTLIQIFPAVDREVIEWVLEANTGDLGKSIEALLEMSSGT
ncbi:uncharacterized protein BT62DRAFT_933387 [Guyanagaster necrorhizus]|uniref:Guanine nucleotide exchange factor Vps9 n=1 Tax=Guyanagaster necrorhizus TaxID=856835 RepID=A0A9P7VPF3_9AGAR|nr:uncharacterized protein BT62DRAFT_933387 [Guyanagaster necrorhizus MCA 3950]KAG7444976.1 hypothetical protein BT62DRAFT_933387 [Guyanagaster necrorhizus MCA 3950]